MDSATKRRNIIVGMAILAVIYGLYDLTVSSRSKGGVRSGEKSAAELQAFVSQTAAESGGSAKNDFGAYVLNRAESPWARNPFFNEARASGGAQRPVFSYTGYIQARTRGLAIINNAEYQTGEQLEKEGYFLKEISPSRVIIENRPAKTEIAVPLHN